MPSAIRIIDLFTQLSDVNAGSLITGQFIGWNGTQVIGMNGGSGSPAGMTGNVQINIDGSFGVGNNPLTVDPTTGVVTALNDNTSPPTLTANSEFGFSYNEGSDTFTITVKRSDGFVKTGTVVCS